MHANGGWTRRRHMLVILGVRTVCVRHCQVWGVVFQVVLSWVMSVTQSRYSVVPATMGTALMAGTS